MTPPLEVQWTFTKNFDPIEKRPSVIIFKKDYPGQNITTPVRAHA